jgi:hypothetical protein
LPIFKALKVLKVIKVLKVFRVIKVQLLTSKELRALKVFKEN